MFGFLARSVATGVVVYLVNKVLQERPLLLQQGVELGVNAMNNGLTKLGDYITTKQNEAAAQAQAAPPSNGSYGSPYSYGGLQ